MDNNLIKQVRLQHPITFTVANTVTSVKVADALSALGASPIMSVAPEEASELVNLAHAVVLNLGTPSRTLESEFNTVATLADRTQTPLVLDPVACGSTDYRWQLANQLLNSHHFSIIRGNASEIARLARIDWHSHGIDAGPGKGDLITIAKRCANKYRTAVVLSGEQDVISDGQNVLQNELGTEWLKMNVGSGDILSSIIGTLLGIGASPLTAGLIGCRIVSTAGVNAIKGTHGLGSWQQHFLDELTLIKDNDLL